MNRSLQSIENCIHLPKLFLLLVFLCVVAVAQDTAPISAVEVKYRKKLFNNERLSVFLLEIPPKHASLMHRHETDLLSVFPEGGETKGTIYGKPPKVDKFTVGEVRFRPSGFTHLTENIGVNIFRSVILEFKSPTGAIEPTKPPDTRYCNPGSETACVHTKYLFCTAKFCVQELYIAAGAVWSDKEYASDRMLIAVSDFKLSYKRKGKARKVVKRKICEVEYFRGGSAREWRNVASKSARITTVIFR